MIAPALPLPSRPARLRLLVLDTEVDSPAETFYRALGFQRAGEIPDFATSPQGELRGTALYWKRLP